MCEFCDYKSMAHAFIQRNGIAGVLTPQMQALFPHALRPGCCCPRCGRPLSHEERNPIGRASRSMCGACYEQMVPSHVSEVCMVCGGALPQHKIDMQIEYPREVRAKIHEGDCMARYVAQHCVANGQPDMVQYVGDNLRNLRREYHPAGMQAAQEPGYVEAGCIEAEYYEVSADLTHEVHDRHQGYGAAEVGNAAGEVRALPNPVRALPEPQKRDTVSDFFGWEANKPAREAVPVLRRKRWEE